MLIIFRLQTFNGFFHLQNRLKSSQRDKVKRFMGITQTGEQTAIYCLQHNEWKLDQASDNYFQHPQAYYRDTDHNKIEQLFRRYEDPNDPTRITADGVCRFLDDLRLDAASKLVLIIAWKFRCEKQCEFSKSEFVTGFTELSVDSIESLRSKLPTLDNELRDPNKFKDFYQFTFSYAKEDTQKGIDLDMAIAYWNIVLKGEFKFLDQWCEFLNVSRVKILVKNFAAVFSFHEFLPFRFGFWRILPTEKP